MEVKVGVFEIKVGFEQEPRFQQICRPALYEKDTCLPRSAVRNRLLQLSSSICFVMTAGLLLILYACHVNLNI